MRTVAMSVVMLVLVASTCDAANSALYFNGSVAQVAVADSATMHLDSAFTLEAWIRQTDATGQQDIIYKWSGSGYVDQRSYFMQVFDGKILLSFSSTGQYAEGRQSLFSDASIPLGQWTHVAGVFSNSTLSIFINGHRDTASLSVPGETPYHSTSPVFVGSGVSAGYETFEGGIDEVRISSVARYDSGFAVPSSEFVADANTLLLLHMNEGQGLATVNVGMLGGDGTLVGGVSWDAGPPIPEPATLSLLAIGLGAMTIRRRRSR